MSFSAKAICMQILAVPLVLIFIMTQQTLFLGRLNSAKYKTIAKYKYMSLHWFCKVSPIAGQTSRSPLHLGSSVAQCVKEDPPDSTASSYHHWSHQTFRGQSCGNITAHMPKHTWEQVLKHGTRGVWGGHVHYLNIIVFKSYSMELNCYTLALTLTLLSLDKTMTTLHACATEDSVIIVLHDNVIL